MFDFITDEAQRTQAEEAFKSATTSLKDEITTTLKTDFDKQIEGLKTKNNELLDEKKKLQKKFEGIDDPNEALEALKLLNENEEIRMIKEGKFEEVIERRTSGLRTEYEEQLLELTNKLSEASDIGVKYKGLFESKTIDDTLRSAASKAGVQPHAIEDILNRGRQIFSVSEDGSVEAREGRKLDGKLLKIDDKVMTPLLWVESLKTIAPHYWPSSSGGGYNVDISTLDTIDAQIAKAAAANDTKSFRALRAKKKQLELGKG